MLTEPKIPLEKMKDAIILINKYEKLLEKVPNSIYFPLFEVSCDSVKAVIDEKLRELKAKIIARYESFVIENLKQLTEQYISILLYIRHPSTSAEEVEAMEKFIMNLGRERINMNLKASDCF